MRMRIRLDTMADINKFVAIAGKISEPVHLTDGNHFKVSGKSMLGAVYTMEWSEVYCECEKDISGQLMDFIVCEP